MLEEKHKSHTASWELVVVKLVEGGPAHTSQKVKVCGCVRPQRLSSSLRLGVTEEPVAGRWGMCWRASTARGFVASRSRRLCR